MTTEAGAISPELVERMVACLRAVVARSDEFTAGFSSMSDAPTVVEARAILALAPKPVDPDLIEARQLAGYGMARSPDQGRLLRIAHESSGARPVNRDYFSKPLQGNGRDGYGYGKTGPFERERDPALRVALWGAAVIVAYFVWEFLR